METIGDRLEVVRSLKEDFHLWVECPECDLKFKMLNGPGRHGRTGSGELDLLAKRGRAERKRGRANLGAVGRQVKISKWAQRRTFR